jgi:putative phosphoesterase
MRIALLADIHGNSIALDAVFTDIQAAGGVDGYWILGDLAAIGFDPVGVMERLAGLPNATFIRGNTDRYITTGDRPPPFVEDARANADLIPILEEVAGGFGWTQGYLTPGGWLDWLEKLPLDQRITLPDGTRVLLVHAAPGIDDGEGIHLASSDADIETATKACEADLLLVGHTHCTFDRRVKGVRVINPGSISNGFAPDLRASYAILDMSENGYQLDFRRVDYDRQAVIEALKHLRHPGAAYIISFMEGRVQSKWLKKWLAMQNKPA